MKKKRNSPTGPFNLAGVAQALAPIRKRFIQQVSFTSEPALEKLLAANTRLIHVVSHGPMLGPWPVGAWMAQHIADSGGGERRPFAEAHRLLFNVPFVGDFISRTFNTEGPFRFEGVLQRLIEGELTDYIVLPEGDNCNFDDQDYLRDFRSHRYLELAIRAQVPLLLTVHRGTEAWSTAVRMDEFSMRALHLLAPILYHRLAQHRIFNFPALPTPIPHLRIASKLYTPKLTAAALPDDPTEVKALVREESHHVRGIMNDMLHALDKQAAVAGV